MVSEILQNGVIRPSTISFASLVVMVKGIMELGICVDYRGLSQLAVKDKFPISIIDDLLDELHGATIFLKLDLRNGYHQVKMSDYNVYKTTFKTHNCHQNSQ